MGMRPKAKASVYKQKPVSAAEANVLTQALIRRVDQRTAASGTLTLPAVPALLDFYVELCAALFAAVGRAFADTERARARAVIDTALRDAFRQSPRSKLVVHFEAQAGHTLGYEVQAQVSSIADAYERWIGTSDKPLFGTHADARVWNLAVQMSDPTQSPILDLGAGTGRNAFALARRGHPVDAVEITPKFAEMMSTIAVQEALPLRVIMDDVLNDDTPLRRDYKMLFASEVVPDFRSVEDLRRLFTLADRVLAEGGLLVFNVHLAALGYTPERAAREFAQQCYSALFTTSEVTTAAADLPFTLQSNDSVHDYEQTHLPAEAWPPTPWFINWSLGLDVFETERARSPVELRWLVFRKTSTRGEGPTLQRTDGDDVSSAPPRARRFDTSELRRALLQRLKRRWQASGTYTFPAVPNLREHYVGKCLRLFEVLGRKHGEDQRQQAREIFDRVLAAAYAKSARSNIEVSYQAPMGTELRYAVTADAVPIAEMYEDWFERLPPPLFGSHPDARLLELLKSSPRDGTVLDLGAGTGRNALHLARKGYAVVAIELAPKLAQAMRREAELEHLSLRVIEADLFEELEASPDRYSLILMAGVGSDFRDTAQLRRFFTLAAERLTPGGYLMASLHIAIPGYNPDLVARQWAQQCCAMFFTRDELEGCSKPSGLRLTSDESVFDFESTHLPVHAWPPTPAYIEWVSCQHLFALPRERCPVELRWLIFRKDERNGGA